MFVFNSVEISSLFNDRVFSVMSCLPLDQPWQLEGFTLDCYNLPVKQVQGTLANHSQEVVHRKIRGFPDFFPRCSSLTDDCIACFPALSSGDVFSLKF